MEVLLVPTLLLRMMFLRIVWQWETPVKLSERISNGSDIHNVGSGAGMNHAYLILTHSYNYVLEIQLKCIDDERNDIYVHVDSKAKNFPFDKVIALIKYAGLFFVDRISANWASYQLVQAELILLERAREGGRRYSYYHLLSGADLPLKNQDDIHRFFEVHEGTQFLEISKPCSSDYDRVQFFYCFQNAIVHGDNTLRNRGKIKFQRVLVKLQEKMNWRRNRTIRLYKGAQWFSITDDCAQYIIEHKKKIKAIFENTLCPDEFFLQTLLADTPFAGRIYIKHENPIFNSMRYIDWTRGNPYVFRKEDYAILMKSEMLFARKFSEEVDVEIIDKIFDACALRQHASLKGKRNE